MIDGIYLDVYVWEIHRCMSMQRPRTICHQPSDKCKVLNKGNNKITEHRTI